MLILLGFFVFFIVIQLIYILFVFSRVAVLHIPTPENIGKLPGVSVVIAAWNELENLQELLPILDKQQYPVFEVIVMDDRSWDGTFDFLRFQCEDYLHVRTIRIDETPNHITSKKFALSRGIMAAKCDIVLLIDADCRPASENWIRTMVASLTPEKDIVLGFSPYQKKDGFLNNFIRFDTFYTALQYVSLALVGSPYMGVGRNLMYRRKIFVENKGFAEHNNVLGGDDDLFINRVANSENVAICLHPEAYVTSIPKNTFDEWFTQKKRHLSVGKHYRFKFKWILGLLSISHIFSWLLFIILVALNFLNTPLIWWVLGIFGTRLIAQWIVFGYANKILGHTLSNWSFPFFDLIFTAYYAVMGTITAFTKKNNIRWK